MRIPILALTLALASIASAQDPRIPNDQRVQPAGAGAPPPQIPQEPTDPSISDLLDRDTSTAALTSPRSTNPEDAGSGGGAVGGLVDLGKRLFNTAVMGKTTLEDPKLQRQRDEEDGVERLSKENWDDVIVKSEKGDLFVILVIGPPRDPVDLKFYEAHKNATKLASERGGMPGVHWARVDYIREVEICTRWLVMRTPVLALVTDQGKSLRFLSKWHLAEGGQGLYDLIKSGDWDEVEEWKSRYGPGGDRQWLVEQYLDKSQKWSSLTSGIPHIVWVGAFAMLTQSLMKWLHSKPTSNPSGTGAGAPLAANKNQQLEDKGTAAARKLVNANRAKLEQEVRERRIREKGMKDPDASGSSTSTPDIKKRK